MTKKKATSKSKKPAGKAPTAVQVAISELVMAIGSAKTDDKESLVRQIITMVQNQSTGRKRKFGRDVAKSTLDKILAFYHSPDVPAILAEEIIEMIQLGDMFFDEEGAHVTLNQPLKVGEESVETVLMRNLSVGDFLALEAEPMELLHKGGSMGQLLPIVQRVIGCSTEEAQALTPGDVSRLWGLFGCFFLGR